MAILATEQSFCVLDYETRSEVNLKEAGAYEYARHPSTEIICVAWRVFSKNINLRDNAVGATKTKVWTHFFKDNDCDIRDFARLLLDSDVRLVAHNALFEQCITEFVLKKYIKGLPSLPINRWVCTASLAAALALPRSLEAVAAALGLAHQKDMEGRRLILKWCKPRKPTKNNTDKWHQERVELHRLMKYCGKDVDVTSELLVTLPPLHSNERKVWLLDQKINKRGFLVDRTLVNRCLKMINKEVIALNEETFRITDGYLSSTTKVASLTNVLKNMGCSLVDLRAKTVEDVLASGVIDDEARRLLEIRQSVSKTSTKKFQAFEARSRIDGRARDNLMYHGASTGRWSGVGIQVQNLPKPKIKDTDVVAEMCKHANLENISLLFGDPMTVFSSIVRSVIIAPEGRDLFCGDYAAIEARVVFWLAKHEKGIKAFATGEDLYKQMATRIYNRDVSEITSAQRQLGKTAILGCGFGMGKDKFFQTCANFGMPISVDLAETAVAAYRSEHWPVKKLWSDVQSAAIEAVLNPDKKYVAGRCVWFMHKDFLKCRLLSGRCLSYQKPEVKSEVKWERKVDVLYHYEVNPVTFQWSKSHTYGGKLVENITQAIARDIMAESMFKLEDKNYEIVLTVHDEILCEKNENEGSLEEFKQLMSEPLVWASDCPIKVEAWRGKRYRKG